MRAEDGGGSILAFVTWGMFLVESELLRTGGHSQTSVCTQKCEHVVDVFSIRRLFEGWLTSAVALVAGVGRRAWCQSNAIRVPHTNVCICEDSWRD